MLREGGKNHRGPQGIEPRVLKHGIGSATIYANLRDGSIIEKLSAIIDLTREVKRGNIKEANARAYLKEALNDEASQVRWSAVYALGKMGICALPELQEALKSDCPVVKSMAAGMIYGALKSEEPKKKAKEFLPNTPMMDLINALIDELGSEEHSVAVYATSALSEIARRNPMATYQVIANRPVIDEQIRERLAAVESVLRSAVVEASEGNRG